MSLPEVIDRIQMHTADYVTNMTYILKASEKDIDFLFKIEKDRNFKILNKK